MVSSPYEWKILEWDDKLQKKKQQKKPPNMYDISSPLTGFSFLFIFFSLFSPGLSHVCWTELTQIWLGIIH